MLDTVMQAIPAIVGARDEEIRALASEMIEASIESFKTAVVQDIPEEEIEPPWLAVKYARRLAWEGVTIDAILRGYRLGHEVLFRRLISVAQDHGPGDPAVMEFVRRAGTRSFRTVDVLCTEVAARFASERETLLRGALARRAGVIRALLAGEPLDQHEAETTLGYRLGGRHLALLLWRPSTRPDEPSPSLDQVAESLAEPLASGRPLVVNHAPDLLACWFGAGGEAPDWTAVEALLPEDCRIAYGRVGTGVTGFRESHRQADRARRVALAGGPSSDDKLIVPYDEVALVSLLVEDPAAARAFVEDELGGLAARDASSATLRKTLLVLLRSGGQQEASEELFVHRNTITQRVRKAEELLGRPLRIRQQETEAALLISEWLGTGSADV